MGKDIPGDKGRDEKDEELNSNDKKPNVKSMTKSK